MNAGLVIRAGIAACRATIQLLEAVVGSEPAAQVQSSGQQAKRVSVLQLTQNFERPLKIETAWQNGSAPRDQAAVAVTAAQPGSQLDH